jgi:ankyrin repeat protein
LHYAARDGYIKIVELLLANGADVNLGEKYYSRTAAELAMNGNHNEVVELLIAKGANVNARDGAGRTPHMVCREERPRENRRTVA